MTLRSHRCAMTNAGIACGFATPFTRIGAGSAVQTKSGQREAAPVSFPSRRPQAGVPENNG
jgi:hypothetical protein